MMKGKEIKLLFAGGLLASNIACAAHPDVEAANKIAATVVAHPNYQEGEKNYREIFNPEAGFSVEEMRKAANSIVHLSIVYSNLQGDMISDSCGGVISKNSNDLEILTAHHCIDFTENAKALSYSKNSYYQMVSIIVTFKGVDYKFSKADEVKSIADLDIAKLRFKDITIRDAEEIATISNTANIENANIFIIGFPATLTVNKPGKVQNYITSTGGKISYSLSDKNLNMLDNHNPGFLQANGVLINHGESGSGVFLKINDKILLVAIVSQTADYLSNNRTNSLVAPAWVFQR